MASSLRSTCASLATRHSIGAFLTRAAGGRRYLRLPVPACQGPFLLRPAPLAGLQQLLPRRVFASGAPETKSSPLLCGTKTNTGKFGGAIAHRLKAEGVAVMELAGEGPMHNALKSMVIASGYLQDDLKTNELVTTVEKITWKRPLGHNGPMTESAAYRFTTKMAPGKRSQGEESNFIRLKVDANPGVIAGVVSAKVKETGQATFTSMGAASANRAIKAIILAEGYLEETLAGKSLGFVVEMQKFHDNKQNSEVGRLLITCSPYAA